MKVKALVVQLCLTLCYPMDCCLPGSSVHGILQARVLEWVVISSIGDLPDPGIEPRFPALQADSLPPEPSGKPIMMDTCHKFVQTQRTCNTKRELKCKIWTLVNNNLSILTHHL